MRLLVNIHLRDFFTDLDDFRALLKTNGIAIHYTRGNLVIFYASRTNRVMQLLQTITHDMIWHSKYREVSVKETA
jgi:hypothetical protein